MESIRYCRLPSSKAMPKEKDNWSDCYDSMSLIFKSISKSAH